MNECNLKIYTAMRHSLYHELKESCERTQECVSEDYGLISDDRAIEIIHNQFGFVRDLIKIERHITVWEVIDGKLNKAGTACRVPCYSASDWNYIRFTVCGLHYELVNDSLELVAE